MDRTSRTFCEKWTELLDAPCEKWTELLDAPCEK